jgi:hypothetical protein
MDRMIHMIRPSAFIEPSVTGFPNPEYISLCLRLASTPYPGLDLDKRKMPALRVIAGEDV